MGDERKDELPPCPTSDDGEHDLRRGPLGAVGNRVGAILQCRRCHYIAPGVDMVDLDAKGATDGT